MKRRPWRDFLIVTRYELADAVRSRRAAVVLVLYLAVATLSCNAFINIMHKLEAQLAVTLQIPSVSSAGTVTDTLWKSGPFRRMMTALVGDRELALGLLRVPPIALVYGWLAFLYTPVLVLLTSSTRVAEEVAAGSARFVLFRTSRLVWCFGKFAGQALLVILALALSAAGAWLVAKIRLSGMDDLLVARHMALYAARAWLYAVAFIGLGLGISQVTASPNLAAALGFLAWVGLGALHWASVRWAGEGLRRLWDVVQVVIPHGHWQDLWRADAWHVASASAYLILLGVVYLLAGYARFARRDL